MGGSAAKVAVVGGGLGGLAAACVAAARGHRVTLYDKNAWLGGKAAVLHDGGFRFDMGPTILTVPRVLERIFAEAGRNLERLPRPAPARSAMALLLRRRPAHRPDRGHRRDGGGDGPLRAGPQAGDGYRRFQAISAHLHEVSNRFFFWKPVEDLFDTIDVRANLNPATLRDVLSLRMGRPSPAPSAARSRTRAWRRCSTISCSMSGSSPYGAPAVLCAIAHMQAAEGVWYPIGGTRAVAEALARLAGELGASCGPARTSPASSSRTAR